MLKSRWKLKVERETFRIRRVLLKNVELLKGKDIKKERKGGLIWKSASDEVDLKTTFIKKVLSND